MSVFAEGNVRQDLETLYVYDVPLDDLIEKLQEVRDRNGPTCVVEVDGCDFTVYTYRAPTDLEIKQAQRRERAAKLEQQIRQMDEARIDALVEAALEINRNA